MKKILFLFFLPITSLFGQTPNSEQANTHSRYYLEFMSIPPFHASLGLGITSGERNEHVVSVNHLLLLYINALGVRYNFNHTFSSGKTLSFYVPFWVGLKRVNQPIDEGDTGDLSDYAFLSAGSGIGMKVRLWKRHFVKVELGTGAAVVAEASNYENGHRFYPYYTNLSAFSLSKTSPVIPSLRLNIRYAIKF